jgi:glucokinase
MNLLAVDIGGTKIALAVISDHGQVIARDHQPIDLSGPRAVVEQIAAFGEPLITSHQIEAAGVSVPAVLERNTDVVIWAPNLPGWQNIRFREMLQERLHRPTYIEYDGHAAALGEWQSGAARGYQNVASVIIGTGIGGGFIVEGRLWRGRDRLAGAVGWFPMMGPDGLDHWENLAAGPAIAQRAQRLIRVGQPSMMEAEALTAKTVFDAARAGDAIAKQVIEETAALIGQGIASVISLANPEIVVLGGSVGRQGDLLLEIVQENVRRWAQPISARDVAIVSSTLGEEAGLLGAAYAAVLRHS